MIRTANALLTVALLLSGCASQGDSDPSATSLSPTLTTTTTAVTPPPSSMQAPPTSTTLDPTSVLYRESFELAWSTIDEQFYDPAFGGVDWAEVGERYRPRALAAVDDEAFLLTLNEMFLELDSSHLFALPPEADFIDPALTAEGEIGIDVRLLDGAWVVVAVEADSAAAAAGIRPGFVIDSVGGQEVAEIAAAAPLLAPLHDRGYRSSQILAVEEALLGEPGTDLALGYRDELDEAHEITLTFRRRESSAELLPGFPPVYTTLVVESLEGDIGYIAFDPFVPALESSIVEAIKDMRDESGLIVDVRGNHGGNSEVGKRLIDNLAAERTLLWTWQDRTGAADVYTDPVTDPFNGLVVVLVDVMSGSAAEAFAGGLQAIGRATIVGERTAGRVLGAEVAELPLGALMVYPSVRPVLGNGAILESIGVVPDWPVSADRADLLAGVDPALEAAVEYLLSGD